MKVENMTTICFFCLRFYTKKSGFTKSTVHGVLFELEFVVKLSVIRCEIQLVVIFKRRIYCALLTNIVQCLAQIPTQTLLQTLLQTLANKWLLGLIFITVFKICQRFIPVSSCTRFHKVCFEKK